MSPERSDQVRVEISSPPDRELPVANIMVDGIELGEIRQEGGSLKMEIYPRPNREPWSLSPTALATAILHAKDRLEQFLPDFQTDELTGLSNRVGIAAEFEAMLTSALATFTPSDQEVVWTYIIDLDDFKRVNDVHGHEVGDELLIRVATRFRETFPSGIKFGRMGSDEFVAVYLGDVTDGMSLKEALNHMFAEPFPVSSGIEQVGATVGAAFSSPGIAGTTTSENFFQDLLRRADLDLYQAKVAKKTKALAVYSP